MLFTVVRSSLRRNRPNYDAHPTVAYDLLSKIPRLEPIAWMIQQQNRPAPETDDSQPADMRMGAKILRLILDYEKLIHKGASRTEAAHNLARQNTGFNPDFFLALVKDKHKAAASKTLLPE